MRAQISCATATLVALVKWPHCPKWNPKRRRLARDYLDLRTKHIMDFGSFVSWAAVSVAEGLVLGCRRYSWTGWISVPPRSPFNLMNSNIGLMLYFVPWLLRSLVSLWRPNRRCQCITLEEANKLAVLWSPCLHGLSSSTLLCKNVD